ncbi:MAG: RHS repeat-associated core domain-containing protein, partial [Verrucomicrobiota bacterium]
PSGDLVNLNFGFDRNSNRIYRQNVVADATPPPVLPSSSSSSPGLPAPAEDQFYAYDELNRLTDFQIGRLAATPTTGLAEKRFEQQWGLDAVGNWDRFDQSSDGGPIDLEQTRDHNEVNEITGITNDPLPSWSPPAYDAAGNTTSLPRPDDLTNSYTAVYDAWNRLVRLSDGSDPVTEYDYDGRGYRITRRSYTDGNLDETRELYYSSRWQVLEERVGGSVKEHYVWGLNINGLIVRDRDVGGAGFDERLYVLQDALFSVAAVADAAGTVLERYEYDAYGRSDVLNGSFVPRGTSQHAWTVRYNGYIYNLKTGLYNARYRDYHAELGRWLTRDPLFNQWGDELYGTSSSGISEGASGDVVGLNLYDYVLNNPVNGTDPNGLYGWLLIPLIPFLVGCDTPEPDDEEEEEETGDCMCDGVMAMFTGNLGPAFSDNNKLVIGAEFVYTIAVSGDDTSQCMCTLTDNGT